MLPKLYQLYASLFARPFFYKWNKLLFELSIRGLGMLNSNTFKMSGEQYFIEKMSSRTKEGIIVDVGANVGKYSEHFLSRHPSQQLLAFEPHPTTFQELSKNLASYPQVKLFNKGVSDQKGELELFDYEEKDGSSHASLYKGVIENIHGAKAVSHSVETVALDNILQQYKVGRIQLLKIDTEGHELNVLHGAKYYLTNNLVEVIHIEFNEMNVVSRTYFKDFYDLLSTNYYLYRLLPNGVLPLNEYIPVRMELFAFQNIIAINKKSAYRSLFDK